MFCTPPPLLAILGDSVTGYVELSGVSSEVDKVRNSNLRQQYSATFFKRVTPYVSLRSSLRYYKLDLAQAQSPDVWQEEWQPSGEISWSPPWFTFNTHLQSRSSQSSTLATRLRNEAFGLSFKTRTGRFPVLTLRNDITRVRESGPDASRKNDEQRFHGALDYSIGKHSFSEGYTNGRTHNLVTGWKNYQDMNTFRWSYASHLFQDDRLRYSTSYTHNYRHQLDRVPGGGTVFTLIPVISALFADNPAPEFGELEPLPQLSDGNTEEPSLPQIDIGSGAINRNIGVDFGFARPVSALHLYLDRASGPLEWQIYTSTDNLNWSRYSVELEVVLNLGYNRFELVFPTVTTRYIKAINSGLNEVTTVYLTEIQALLESETEAETESHSQMHFLDFAVGYRFSEKLNSSFSGTYQQEPVQGVEGDRRNLYYSLSTRFRQTDIVSHTAKFQQSLQDFDTDSTDLKNLSASYNLLVAPLTTLDFLLSISSRIGYYGAELDQESGNTLLAVRGSPFSNLHLTWETGFSQQTQHAVSTTTDSWIHRLIANAALTRKLDASFSMRHQFSRIEPAQTRRARRQFQLNLNYRATSSIFLRGTTDLNLDETATFNLDFLFSWNVTKKVKMGLQTYFSGDDGGIDTGRLNTNFNYKLGTRSTVFMGFTVNDYRGAGGTRTSNLQEGLRTGF